MTDSFVCLTSKEVRDHLRPDFGIWKAGFPDLLTSSRYEGGGEPLSEASGKNYWEGYVSGCAILGRLGMFDPNAASSSRWTEDTIRVVDAAPKKNGQPYAPKTRIARLTGLAEVLLVLDPSLNIDFIDDALSKIKPKTVREKKLVDPEVIKAVAIKIMGDALVEMPDGWRDGEIPKDQIQRARRAAAKYQGGMLLLWLAILALRIANLKSIEQADDKSLRKVEGKWWLIFARTAMKGRKAYDRMVPYELQTWLDTFLDFVRPILCRTIYNGDCLWVSTRGEPLGVQGIRKQVKALTLKHLNVELTPHLFRHCVATAKARLNPEDISAAAWILTDHHDMTNTTYNHAGSGPARYVLAERSAQMSRSRCQAAAPRSNSAREVAAGATLEVIASAGALDSLSIDPAVVPDLAVTPVEASPFRKLRAG